jgi:hypothetical protein
VLTDRPYYSGYTEEVRPNFLRVQSLIEGFNTGNSNNKIYDGQFLADNEDVVVVSFKSVTREGRRALT